MRKRRVMTAILWGGLVIWLGIIYYFSTQNGEQTAATGMLWAKKLSVIVYENPSDAQIADFHMILRKSAHLFLFSLLGSITTWISAVTFPKAKGILRAGYLFFAVCLTVGCGYFDEWHKQFISGRHFDHAETLLNMKAGIAGVIFAVAVIAVCRVVRYCMEEEA
ncbi:MAG: VanZ family protein [Hespellia sp.]|nr:VanZ family protein [Hespellia sp.]